MERDEWILHYSEVIGNPITSDQTTESHEITKGSKAYCRAVAQHLNWIRAVWALKRPTTDENAQEVIFLHSLRPQVQPVTNQIRKVK